MITQENIGWSHMFAGHISQEWIKLHENSRRTNDSENQNDQSYLWGTALVEVLLSEFVRLWELRNQEIHGETKERNEILPKKRLTIETKRLNSLREDARPGDRFLFHENVDEFIEKSTAKRIGSWVRSHRVAIKNSVLKWKKSSVSGTKSILDWLSTANTSQNIAKVYKRQHKLWMDGRQKERRRKQPLEKQRSIMTYFSLVSTN